jgi:hypothetical protein
VLFICAFKDDFELYLLNAKRMPCRKIDKPVELYFNIPARPEIS